MINHLPTRLVTTFISINFRTAVAWGILATLLPEVVRKACATAAFLNGNWHSFM